MSVCDLMEKIIPRFNRTFMELKYQSDRPRTDEQHRFNRTFMELKSILLVLRIVILAF